MTPASGEDDTPNGVSLKYFLLIDSGSRPCARCLNHVKLHVLFAFSQSEHASAGGGNACPLDYSCECCGCCVEKGLIPRLAASQARRPWRQRSQLWNCLRFCIVHHIKIVRREQGF